MALADLHLHTIFSDGAYTPEELISASLAKGLDCIAITDHDTVSGIQPCIDASAESKIEIVPAIELSSQVEGRQVHILGYFINYQDKDLLKKLSHLKQIRIDRTHKMVDKLKSLGLKDINVKEVMDLAGKGVVGRMHLAIIM